MVKDNKRLKIKVCGMRDATNINELIALRPDFIGFIFYPPSKRFAGKVLKPSDIAGIPDSIAKTGVFVNEKYDEILKIKEDFNLDAVQLHGNETPDFCKSLQKTGVKVLKAFHMDEAFDFSVIEPYVNNIDYVLFDTKTPEYGGSGKKFNWSILESYKYNKPFLLSGGISIDDLNEIKKIKNTAFYGVDINSKFETAPAFKNINMIKEFMQKLL